MEKKHTLIRVFCFVGIAAIIVVSLLVLNPSVSFTHVATITTPLQFSDAYVVVVSSDELQRWIEEDYSIDLGPQDYSSHSLILSFNHELTGLSMHRGSHPGYYKPTVRSRESLNYCTPYCGETVSSNTIFVYTTNRTDIVSEDEYEFTCWD